MQDLRKLPNFKKQIKKDNRGRKIPYILTDLDYNIIMEFDSKQEAMRHLAKLNNTTLYNGLADKFTENIKKYGAYVYGDVAYMKAETLYKEDNLKVSICGNNNIVSINNNTETAYKKGSNCCKGKNYDLITQLHLKGINNHKIAEILGIHPNTVSNNIRYFKTYGK